MDSKTIRQHFFDFFKSKQHKIVPSAPIVNKDDPTLMFTNAGMNQFKDFFLGNKEAEVKRLADTQKCLRVSGKHNDLEEVGVDGYHHTMFEMLGNWSIGEYFKQEAIDWAWELLTEVYGLDKDRLYATIFEGDKSDDLALDEEAKSIWSAHLPQDRILNGNKKDNFWEMGETGPCGPCSEIHVDLRSDEDRAKVPGAELVNMDHPEVIEIWNLVFIQYNRNAAGQLESLPAKHIDTGMGFERLTMALQGKKTTYDTDIFMPMINAMEGICGKKYTASFDAGDKKDIAFRVVADHIRAVCFTIADGQLPSNTGAGYVVRRILRRAVRYYYSFLDVHEPLMTRLVGQLADQFELVFPELFAQKDFVAKVVAEEEASFLRTLEEGIKRFSQLEATNGVIDGRHVFELYDTYGFPYDLTALMANEKGWSVDEKGFKAALEEQKSRSRADATKSTGDWHWLDPEKRTDIAFMGYDFDALNAIEVLRYREVEDKKGKMYQLVLSETPFYAQGGGQVGDSGWLIGEEDKVRVLDTVKENDLIIHLVNQLPKEKVYRAEIDKHRRQLITRNHSATHLLHAALRQVLGDHVHQKGSLVNDKYLRFDFSHFQKVEPEQLKEIEQIVNSKIHEAIALDEAREVPIAEAKERGAMMLFGEKYGETVRMITFDPEYSVELCGGCHVSNTSDISLFKITSESAIAAGVRRIEALTSEGAIKHLESKVEELADIQALFKNSKHIDKQILALQEENKKLAEKVAHWEKKAAGSVKDDLLKKVSPVGDYQLLCEKVSLDSAKQLKSLVFEIQQTMNSGIILLAADVAGKPQLMLSMDKSIPGATGLNAGNVIREIASHINGGGGGQPFFASAGGSNVAGLEAALEMGRSLIDSAIK